MSNDDLPDLPDTLTSAIDAFTEGFGGKPHEIEERLTASGDAPDSVGALSATFEALAPMSAEPDADAAASAALARIAEDEDQVTHSLTVESDDDDTITLPLAVGVTTIGREPGNSIVLSERNVSRLHCEVHIAEDGSVEIHDFSRYGTIHNGQHIDGKAPLRRGDVLQIGDFRIRINVARRPVARVDDAQQTTITPLSPDNELQPNQAGRLVIISSNFHGREFFLTREQNIIGRVDADFTIDHRSISSWHAKVVREGDTYKLVDLGSSNGVIINGEKYRSASLNHNDDIELGHVKLRFVAPGEAFVFEPAPVAGSGPGLIVWVGVAAALLLLLGGGGVGLALMASSDDAPDEEVAVPEAPEPDEGEAASSEGASDAEIAGLIDKGDGAFDEGEWDKASVYYDMVVEKQPANARAKKQKSLIARERPFKKHYERGKRALDAKRYDEAVDAFDKLPSGVSMFADKVRDEGLLDSARAGLLEAHLTKARDAIASRDWSDARRALREARRVDPDNADIDKLRKKLNKLDKRGARAEARAEKRRRRRRRAGGSGGGGGDEVAAKAGDGGDGGGGGGGGGSLSPEEKRNKRKELLSSARKKSMTGDNAGAISDAQASLKYGGGAQAHYFMAIAYEKQGNNAQAVKHYNVWLKSHCGSKLADRVRQKISGMGGQPGC